MPLAELPSRLERQMPSTRGKFSGASGSSAANFRAPDFSWAGTYSPTLRPAASASSATWRELRSNVG